jgi:hypothetical protein
MSQALRWTVALLYFLLGIAASASARGFVYETNFAWNRLDKSHIIVMVSINDSKPAPFILDTGFEVTLLLNPSYKDIKFTKKSNSVLINGNLKATDLEDVKYSLQSIPEKLEINEPLSKFSFSLSLRIVGTCCR